MKSINNISSNSDMKLMSIGVSMPENLLLKFNDIIIERGYSSRSEGIRDAIRNYINYYEWMKNIKGPRVATITLIYDIQKRNIVTIINEAQAEYSKIINSSIRLFLDKYTCLEVIILKGDGILIKKLSEYLLSQNGVKFSKLTTIFPVEE